MSTIPHWPCDCINWCRRVEFKDGKPVPHTAHHPRCEHVDASLMDVWRVQIPGEETGCITHCETDAHRMAAEDPHAPLEVVPLKMHREIYEHLGEFAGF